MLPINRRISVWMWKRFWAKAYREGLVDGYSDGYAKGREVGFEMRRIKGERDEEIKDGGKEKEEVT